VTDESSMSDVSEDDDMLENEKVSA
jgi:hypothetical protein